MSSGSPKKAKQRGECRLQVVIGGDLHQAAAATAAKAKSISRQQQTVSEGHPAHFLASCAVVPNKQQNY
jgi:hypothetical protein